MSAAPSLPLAAFTVLDLTRVRAGPTAVRQLADWGADVIKIEPPIDPAKETEMGGQRLGPDYQNLQRNKRSLALDLKHPDGVDVLKRLAKHADVLAENYRPQVKHRLGIDYDTMSSINPGLVYASISGFGQTGPYANRPGYDQIAQGMGGLMSVTGIPGQGPVRAGIAVADTTAGLYASIAILIALLDKQRTGLGQWVQTSLLQAQLAVLDLQAARWLVSREVPGQAGNDHPTMIPTGLFHAKDGPITLQVPGDVMWARFVRAIGRPEWEGDERYCSNAQRSAHRVQLNEQINAVLQEHPREHWIETFNQAGIACGAVNTVDQAFDDPQVRQLGMRWPVSHPQMGDIELVGQPIHSNRYQTGVRRIAPMPGEHSDDVLAQFGFSQDEIADLRKHHVI